MSNKVKIDEKVFDFVYEMAMRDATLQKAYEGEKSAPKKCEDAKKIISKYIDSLLNGNAPDFYEVEKDFENRINEELTQRGANAFTFGNCQKVINMTAKYFYIATYANEELRKKFKGCHCPMDNIMINVVIDKIMKKYVNVNDFLEEQNKEKSLDIEKPSITYLRRSWSKIAKDDHKQYDLFQEVVKKLAELEKNEHAENKADEDEYKKEIYPIEYDYLVWNNSDADNQN